MRFLDGTKVTVNGLDEIMAELFSLGRPSSKDTAEELLSRLEASKNHIPSSAPVRREYAQVVLATYKEYAADHGAKEVDG